MDTLYLVCQVITGCGKPGFFEYPKPIFEVTFFPHSHGAACKPSSGALPAIAETASTVLQVQTDSGLLRNTDGASLMRLHTEKPAGSCRSHDLTTRVRIDDVSMACCRWHAYDADW